MCFGVEHVAREGDLYDRNLIYDTMLLKAGVYKGILRFEPLHVDHARHYPAAAGTRS